MPSFMDIMSKAKTATENSVVEEQPKEAAIPAFLKPKKEEPVKSTEVQENVAPVEEAIQSEPEEVVQPEEEKEEVITESTEVPQPVSEENNSEETETIIDPATLEANQTEQEEESESVEEAPKKRGRKAGSKKAPKPVVESLDLSDEELVTQVSYTEAITMTSPNIIDEEWENFKQSISEEVNAIVVTSDANPATLRALITQLSEVYSKIWYDYSCIKTQLEYLDSKEDGLIKRTKKINSGDGTNAESREKAGIIACMHYVAPGQTDAINLYELRDFLLSQFNFLDSVTKQISFKKDLIMNAIGSLKLESQIN